MLGLPAPPLPHELARSEPTGDGQHERDHVRPVCVVHEDDLRDDDADGEADEPPTIPASTATHRVKHQIARPTRAHYADFVPELPEVESVRAQLAPVLDGRRFERVEIDDPRLTRPFEPAEVAAELEGERVAAVERRGKYLIVRFESGRVLLIHLRMTGSLRHSRTGARPTTRTAVLLSG